MSTLRWPDSTWHHIKDRYIHKNMIISRREALEVSRFGYLVSIRKLRMKKVYG